MIKFIPQVLALFAVVSVSFFHGPDVYTEFLVREVTGYTGAFEISVALSTYVIGIIFLLCLIAPYTRRLILYGNEVKPIKVISAIVIFSYVCWGTFMLYSLSQATDL